MSQTPSTPVWVPIAVGAIGLIGVLVTQWLAGRRAADERRAADAREERQRQYMREASEAALGWDETTRKYELRQEAYAALALSLPKWMEALRGARAARQYATPIKEEQWEALRAFESAAEEAGAAVELLGSKPVRGVYRATFLRMSVLVTQMRSIHTPMEKVDQSYERALSSYWRLMDFLRIDLGIEPENPEMNDKYREYGQAQAHAQPPGAGSGPASAGGVVANPPNADPARSLPATTSDPPSA